MPDTLLYMNPREARALEKLYAECVRCVMCVRRVWPCRPRHSPNRLLYARTGPAAFPAARKAAAWARWAMVHAADGEEAHYQFAVAAALTHGSVLIAETSSAHADGWARLLGMGQRMPLLTIVPRDGAHPVVPEVLQ